MADLIVDSEEYFAAREAADLLARAREGCEIRHIGGNTDAVLVFIAKGDAIPNLRELAEALTGEKP